MEFDKFAQVLEEGTTIVAESCSASIPNELMAQSGVVVAPPLTFFAAPAVTKKKRDLNITVRCTRSEEVEKMLLEIHKRRGGESLYEDCDAKVRGDLLSLIARKWNHGETSMAQQSDPDDLRHHKLEAVKRLMILNSGNPPALSQMDQALEIIESILNDLEVHVAHSVEEVEYGT